ncbi:caspase family protein [Thermosynechococcaceae cyanobacterium BACA0444]|uniref:Caspase family protein n=1 Tax=Pseudocalidococcus azoricus BACA0444 TaxID=2918990 RepID=A0AAE4FV19_9CYAN|nr:caspase family protein [Pseudocalidococcus azoricus]MDS3861561.1 caspase family protein [Pseudocalidococcus azoricus BACA0444]
MKIAIVIGISDYVNVPKLPGCITDKNAMTQLLEKTSNYTDILKIDENKKTSASIKQEITAFISKYQTKKENIEEVFLYFSGHGEFRDNEFFYLLPDFDEKKFKQTSLENSELDNLIKTLSPELTIKVIDACHAGVSYIKDKSLFESYIKGTKEEFDHCYFLFSSQSFESSYQNHHISDFTHSFLEAIVEFPENTEIRYKDIIDHISDSFRENQHQTPYFVTQAKHTEIFSNVTSEIKSILKSNFLDLNIETQKQQNVMIHGKTLHDRIKDDAVRYCTEEETIKSLNALINLLKQYQNSQDLLNLYSFSLDVINNNSIDFDTASIGLWLSQNENTLFAMPTYKTITVKVKKRKWHPLLGASFYRDDFELVDEKKQVIKGFEATVSLPYLYLYLEASPLYPNLAINDRNIVPLVSETEIRLFYTFSKYRKVSWQDVEQENDLEWLTESFPTRDLQAMEETVNLILGEFEDRIQSSLSKDFS